MKTRILSIILTLAVLLSMLPAVGVLADDTVEDYSWPEMREGLAVRYTVNRSEVTRIYPGDQFQVEFWINAIDPYSMTLPISWDPSVVTMVIEETGEPVSSGKKTEADAGNGKSFSPGPSCYDPSYGFNYRPKYWNGKPVYSAEESSEGYPYVDNENGHCRFFYYVDAATPSASSQLYLTLNFKALKAGDPNFHFATDAEAYYDPASREGMMLAYTSEGVVHSDLEMPKLAVVQDAKDETEVPVNPGVDPDKVVKPGTTGTPTQSGGTTEPTDPQAPDGTEGNGGAETSGKTGGTNGNSGVATENWKPVPNGGAGTGGTAQTTGTSAPVGGIGTATPTVRGPVSQEAAEDTDLADTVHLNWYPYTTPVYVQSVIQSGEDGVIRKGDNYILPESFLAAAINELVNSNASAIVVNMPDRIICKREYEISFSCSNLDDLSNRMDSIIYFETPAGFVGINPAALLSEVGDTAEVTFRVDPVRNGMRLKTKVNGEVVEGFTAPVYVLILPYGGSGEPKVVSSTEFGAVFRHTGQHVLPVSHYFKEKKVVSFLSPAAGTFQVQRKQTWKYVDVPKGYWAYEPIRTLARAGIMNGKQNGAFDPEGNVTRAEMARFLTKLFGTYQTGLTALNGTFSDVALSDPDAPFILSAFSVGLLNGVSEGVFDPEGTVSHQDLCVMVYRGMQLLGINLPEIVANPVIPDADQIEDYALEAVTALAKAGAFAGMPEGSFTPQGTATRAEAAKVLSVIYEQVRKLI